MHAVAPHPSDVNIVYAGAANGGVWRTNALELRPTWTPLPDFLPSLSIGALALDRNNRSQGEVLISRNGGANWTVISNLGLTWVNVLQVVSKSRAVRGSGTVRRQLRSPHACA